MALLPPRHTRVLAGRKLTLKGLFVAFWPQISLTWALTLLEVGLFALIPLIMGRAIDGLLARDMTDFYYLGAVLGGLVLLGTARRIYDTRTYGTMRVALGSALADRARDLPVTRLNARIDMGRELVDFLEQDVPESGTALLRTIAAIVILMSFDTTLALAACAALMGMLLIYGVAHRRFFRLNHQFNEQTEQQVHILASRRLSRLSGHFMRLRKAEIAISDTEAVVYGLIFLVLLGLVMFNLHVSTHALSVSLGTIFAIITYTWDFVESALVLPLTLQSLSRLNEIAERINRTDLPDPADQSDGTQKPEVEKPRKTDEKPRTG